MIAIIAAMSKNYVIGNHGVIPWKIKGEQKRFKELTTGNTVIMGKRSFEEIGRPLPNRKTIVISSTMNYEDENCRTAGSLQEALRLAGASEIYIAGGELLYREALPIADRMYITQIDLEVEGDTFFPEFEKEDFVITQEERFDGEIPYRYLTYVRRRKSDNYEGKSLSEQNGMNEKAGEDRDSLLIRFATPEDSDMLCKWWNDGRVMAHAGFPNGLGTNADEIAKLIRGEDQNNRRLILEIGSAAVGEMNFRIKDNIAEIGIKICDFNYQEKGNGTKALGLLIKYLFLQKGVDKIILDTNLKNTRAQHVYEKLGFRRIRVNTDAWKDQLGELQSFVDYELRKEDYQPANATEVSVQ
jgi:dihydrofolate reductase/RimJ/RimL family protein N-acetyltransferase